MLYEKYKNLNQVGLDNSFITMCNYGHLDDIKFLLTSPQLSLHANIEVNDGAGLAYACMNNHIDIVKYLLTSPDLNKHADIHANDDYPLYCVVNNDYFDLFKYLLSSPELKEHANIHARNADIFKVICFDQLVDMVNYLIFDYKIEMTQDINKYLTEKDTDFNRQVKAMFPVRDLTNALENELASDILIKKRIKL